MSEGREKRLKMKALKVGEHPDYDPYSSAHSNCHPRWSKRWPRKKLPRLKVFCRLSPDFRRPFDLGLTRTRIQAQTEIPILTRLGHTPS